MKPRYNACDMEILAIILGGIAAIVGIVLLVVFVGRFRNVADQLQQLQETQKGDQSMVMLNQNLQGIQTRIDATTKTMQQTLQTQFGQSTKIIQDVTERLTKLDETNRQVVNFADQLQSLQDILKNPKQRGVLGEYYLETVLKNVLPPDAFQMQYKFSDGEIVDAIVRVKEKIIPIDSKFSLENYNRIAEERDETERGRLEKTFLNDLKMRIQETAKYIRPEEKTVDFAFMFIPHEAIYYDLIVNKIGALHGDTENLIQRAASKYHVIIVSPTSFLAYLQTVLQGLRALQIEESAKEIRKNVEQLAKHFQSYETYLQKLGNQLGTTVNTYNAAYKEFGKIDKDVMKISGVSGEVEPLVLEKPDINE
ncbi:MAG: DNA recombination protein RmuC [bacterium]